MSTDQTADGDGLPDSAAEEVGRLLAAVHDWARRTLPPPQAPRSPQSLHDGTAAECSWCPVCQFAAVLRGEHPEITARVLDAGVAVVGALRSIAEAAASPAHQPPQPGAESARPDEPRVQPIRLTDPEDPPGAG